MKNAKKVIISSVIIILVIFSLIVIKTLTFFHSLRECSDFKDLRKAKLAGSIVINLEELYGEDFFCDSLGTYGDLATYICHPVNDPTLHFKGEASSSSGYITASAYPDAILAREDTAIMNDIFSGIPGTVTSYRHPYHGTFLQEYNVYRGEYSIDELRKTIYHNYLWFDVFFDVSDNEFINDPEREYYYLQQCAEELMDFYREASDKNYFVLMHVYYMDADACSSAIEYLNTGHDASNDSEFRFGRKIIIAFGSVEEFDIPEGWQIAPDEFLEERNHIDIYIKEHYGF